MYKNVLLFILMLGVLGCDKLDSSPGCASQVCTLEFRSVNVRFVNKQGQAIVVNNYQAVNLRTGQPVKNAGMVDGRNSAGIYTVVNDSNVAELSEMGDEIRVSASHPGTQQTISAVFKVSGGRCACHIDKISGPDKLMFNE